MIIFTYCVMMIEFLPSKCIRRVFVNFAIFSDSFGSITIII